MQLDEKKKAIFETMPIPKAIMTMAVPTVISQLINLIYNIVDTFFIGQTGNSYMMAAVTVAFPLFIMTVAISNLFGMGGGSLIARLCGKGETENAKKVSAFSVYGSVIGALAYSLLIGLLMEPILNLLGASENTLTFAKQYTLFTVVIGGIPTILSTSVAHLLRNVGHSKQASLGLSGGGILNIILDPLFMFVLLPDGMEVLGAALATCISNLIACLFLLGVLIRTSKTTVLGCSLRDFRSIDPKNRREVFSVGIPSALLPGLHDVSNFVLISLMSRHGDLPLAAMGIVMKAERLPNAINIGICQAMLPIVAYNYASGNRERMQKTIRLGRIYGLSICVVCVALFELFASPITGIFLSAKGAGAAEALTTIGYAALFLRFRCLSSPVQFLNFHTSFCMQAMGDGRDTLIHALFRDLVFYIPFMFLLNALFGAVGLVNGQLAGESCSAILAMILLRRWIKKTGNPAK